MTQTFAWISAILLIAFAVMPLDAPTYARHSKSIRFTVDFACVLLALTIIKYWG